MAVHSLQLDESLPETCRHGVVTVGNFDGVHKGHQALLRKAGEIAARDGKKLAVLTFEPHPKNLFRPDEPPGRLTPPDVKAWRLEREGIDILYSLPFDWTFASMSAESFIDGVLKEGLDISHAVVGRDFRFGQLRKGEAKDIQAAGIPVTVLDDITDEHGAAYSSSRARQALQQGRIADATMILGWEWEIWGSVKKGDGRGKELGYPTANFPLGDTIHPAYGVYAARVNVQGEAEWHNAAINIGIRPMFEIPEAQVESFILGFDRDIYGKTLRVRPVEFLRSEARFASIAELKAQMERDCREAQTILR